MIPGSLLAGPYPGSNDPAEMERRLKALLHAGIRSVIYLVDESENEEPDAGAHDTSSTAVSPDAFGA